MGCAPEYERGGAGVPVGGPSVCEWQRQGLGSLGEGGVGRAKPRCVSVCVSTGLMITYP